MNGLQLAIALMSVFMLALAFSASTGLLPFTLLGASSDGTVLVLAVVGLIGLIYLMGRLRR